MSPTVQVVFRLALQIGSTGESEDFCASVRDVIPNGSSSERKRIDTRMTLFLNAIVCFMRGGFPLSLIIAERK
jgi:hypothetical protein